MHNITLDQLRTMQSAGGVQAVTLSGDGGAFCLRAETRRGAEAMLITQKGHPRRFRQVNKAVALLREMGIYDVRLELRHWNPEQAELERPARPDRAEAMKQVHQDAELVEASVAALKSYEKTGLHITLDEAASWMETWGTPDEATVPVCHQ